MTQIEGITPTSRADRLFRRNQATEDFRAWAEGDPVGCYRRFAIVDLFDYEFPAVSNADVEFVAGQQEIVVAYPNDSRYGGDQRRDMSDDLREDFYSIDAQVGPKGHSNYTDGALTETTMTIEEGEQVTFLVITGRFVFYRSV